MELLQSMKVFAKLAELESFTHTAEAVGIGRSQVTLTIRDLEDRLGVRLFQRTTRKVKLTTEGAMFHERAMEILRTVAQATAMFSPAAAVRGRLRLEIPTSLAQPNFIGSLGEFNEAFPDLEIDLGVTDRVVDLVAESVDCALRFGELPDSTMIARHVCSAVMVTCAAPAYLKANGTPKTVQDLSSHRSVLFLSGSNKRVLPWRFSVNGEEKSFTGHKGIRVNNSDAYVQCGLAAFGIFQAPGIAVQQHLASGDLVEVLTSCRPAPRPISLLYPSGTHLAPPVRAFADWVTRRLPHLHAGLLKSLSHL